MNAIATTICIVIATLCWTWLRTRAQSFETDVESKRIDAQTASVRSQADLMRDMANLGYVQVPVIRELVTEAGTADPDDEEWEDSMDGDKFSERRTWQLAWVPKDQMELMLAVAVNPDAGNADLLEAALRP